MRAEIPQHVQEANRRQMEIFRDMTPAKRWQQFLALRATAWKYKRAGLKAMHQQCSEAEIEKMVRDYFLHATT